MSNEPPATDFKHKVKAKFYAAAEWGGYIWVYIGASGTQAANTGVRMGDVAAG
jgi:phenylpropionate dioxygenase-like ring-hydroxylating dioxygenase large terminal subunit